MLATYVDDFLADSFMPFVSTASLPLTNFKLNDLDRCLRTLFSEEILLMNTWPAKQAQLLVHTFPICPFVHRPPAMLILILPYLPS